MSTISQHLGLIVPDPSDPFVRTDFVSNYNKLDQYPGTFICTSSTRPSWSANQAGQNIYETDTRRVLNWDGSTWHDPQQLPPVWQGSLLPSAAISQNQSVTYTIATITLRRPGTLVTNVHVDARQNTGPSTSSDSFNLAAIPLIDGSAVSLYGGSQSFYSQWARAASTNWNDYRTISAVGVATVAAGTHSIGVQLNAGGDTGASGSILKVGALAMLGNSTDL